MEIGRKWRIVNLLYADNLALCCGTGKNMYGIIRNFVEVCKNVGLDVNGNYELGDDG